MRDRAAGARGPKRRPIRIARGLDRPDEDARAVPWKQIERLTRLLDRPDQWTVQPVPPDDALRRCAHRPRLEPADVGVVAEVEETGHRALTDAPQPFPLAGEGLEAQAP